MFERQKQVYGLLIIIIINTFGPYHHLYKEISMFLNNLPFHMTLFGLNTPYL